MISIDDLVKIVLVFSISFAIIAISIQLVRLIGKMADLMEDSRSTLKNFNDLSTYALEDYVETRNFVKQVASNLSSLSLLFSNPIGLLSKLRSLVRKLKE